MEKTPLGEGVEESVNIDIYIRVDRGIRNFNTIFNEKTPSATSTRQRG
jgi:hypothetical protein